MIKFTGRVGDVVGRKGTKGGIIFSAYQPDVKNPQSLAQVQQRVRFLTATALAAQFTDDALAGLAPRASSMRVSRRTAMASRLMRKDDGTITVSNTTPVEATIGYESVKFSQGTTPEWAAGTLDVQTPMKVKVPFTTKPTEGDYIHIIAICPDLGAAKSTMVVAGADTEEVELTVPAAWQGQKVHVYVYSQNAAEGDQDWFYRSYWNGGDLEAQATARAIENAANYSETVYVGYGTIN